MQCTNGKLTFQFYEFKLQHSHLFLHAKKYRDTRIPKTNLIQVTAFLKLPGKAHIHTKIKMGSGITNPYEEENREIKNHSRDSYTLLVGLQMVQPLRTTSWLFLKRLVWILIF